MAKKTVPAEAEEDFLGELKPKGKSALTGKWVKIVGLGFKRLKKGQVYEVHSSTANNLIDKGLAELAPKK